ncbi:acetylornithine transaminase [uncultured Schumannella sp.]|uniref:acetylornithine transaminase n=1 Tax=uncultured Schumannella sp. TaxID=1195956 RepID=UPI0025F8D32D|nr:acetylornithine transaminase [uncultured Schumannella sp.]
MTARTPELVERFLGVMMKSTPAPLAILERGEGARVWDVDGTEYLDFLAGIAVNALGHAHPVVVDAIHAQASRVMHVSNYFASEPQLELAERLVRLTGGDRVYFANSGAEAIEAAIKLARLTGRPRIVALESSFHGRTMGSLSLTGKQALRTPFEALLPGAAHIAVTLEALEAEFAAHGPELAAIVIEPIQGEAGVVELPAGFLARARELTREHGALLILDEIQTGAGRTGEWFAFQREGIVPDAVALAKGIGGGFPIGALVAFGAASELFQPGQHGSTFGGNPLATATANAVLGEIERAGLIANAAHRGAQLRTLIASLESPLVQEITGAGLLLGVALREPVAAAVVQAAQRRGLIINAAAPGRIRLAPPLIIGDAEIAEFGEKFAAALSDVQNTAGDTP